MKVTAQEISVHIHVDAWQSILHWIALAGDYEVSGLGLVEEERDEDDRLVGYFVTDVFLPEQENGPASTELEPDSVAKLMLEVEEETGASDKLRFWWHYHPRGIGLMWSGTDDECVEELSNGEWFLSTVFNADMACRTRLDLYEPLRITVDQLPTQIRFTDFGLAADCKELFEKRIKRRLPQKGLSRGRRLRPMRADLLDDDGDPWKGRHLTAEELLLAQEQVEAGEMSYAHYLELLDEAEDLIDDGWFAPEPADDDDDNGKEIL